MYLHELRSPEGSRKGKKRVGRGRGSGLGKTSGRGENGQGSRCGSGIVRSSEGGQMPLIRRLPKVGFRSHRPILSQVVHLKSLERFDNGTEITTELLKTAGLINSKNKPFKILNDGEITKSLTIKEGRVSKVAQEKIIKAGGKIETHQKKQVKK
ncbi:MAG: 50S ribosomal protein L15 [Candidatus Omnitrophica bacterium]|nr:50S ribosomal protein L15 [Candidatus Omnitrophota bacterium]